MALVNYENVSKNYGSLQALSNVSFSVEKGRIVGLLGPNCSGKTTLIKLTTGLLTPSSGNILIDSMPIGIETKKIVSYLPDKMYFNEWMTVNETIALFADFYSDFDKQKAFDMLQRLDIDKSKKLKTLSKGTKEKVQLILIMSRRASLYVLDEPIAGVDPAARDYILDTIIKNYSENASIIISTHLIYDIEKILDDVVFISSGRVVLADTVDNIREKENKSIDALFREVFRC